jgi:tripartite-type tricarboxylate transporter receptor subunit TctC
MMGYARALLVLPFLLSSAVAPLSSAAAQQYPTRPITFVVPFPAGGLSDSVARVLAADMQQRLGQSIVVDNRTGATGTIGAGYVAHSAPDGYTLLVESIADVTTPHYLSVPYDIRIDFSAIGMAVEGPPLVLLIKSSLPYKTVKELVDAARASPGKMSFGSSGPGASPSIAISQLKSMAKIDVVEVPYRGATQAVVAVVSGEIDAAFVFQGNAKQLVDGGKVRALALTASRRSAVWDDLPTMIESGFPGFEHGGFVGLGGPARLPEGIIRKLNTELNAVAALPAFLRRFANDGMTLPEKTSPEDYARYISEQMTKQGELAKLASK